MADWNWALGGIPPAGVLTRELTQARQRRLVFRVDGSDEASFAIDGRADEAAAIVDFATDVTCHRDGVKLFRGRIGPSGDQVDANRHTTSVTAIDYRGYLSHRYVIAPLTYAATDQGTIAWNLVAHTQGQTGGNVGITNGIGATLGTTRDRTYDQGKNIADALDELGRVDGGFEWEIDADLALNRWSPRRGTNTGIRLDYGGAVVAFERNVSAADFANAGLVTGDSQTTTPVTFATASVATDPRGRWEIAAGYPTIKEQATLNARSLWVRDNASTITAEYAVTLAPGVWTGKAQMWKGDTVRFTAISGRLAVASDHRIAELVIDIDEDGRETVTLGLVAA